MSGADAKRAWVERVLGLTLPAPETLGGTDDAIAKGDAIAKLVRQCEAKWHSALQRAYKASKPIHAEMSEHDAGYGDGLDSILESYWSDLLGPIAQAGRAGGGPGAAATLLKAVGGLRAEMQGDALFAELRKAGSPVGQSFLLALNEIETILEPVVHA